LSFDSLEVWTDATIEMDVLLLNVPQLAYVNIAAFNRGMNAKPYGVLRRVPSGMLSPRNSAEATTACATG
jgi:hypothetical protein